MYWVTLSVSLPLNDENNNALEVATQTKNNRTKK